MSNELILVVDDNRQMADFMAGRLLRSLGYDALVAYDGKTALEILRTRTLSLMLTDLQLPDFSGLDVLRQLRNEGINVPAILVTAHGSEQIAVDAFRLGVQDYLIKPVDLDSLNAAVTRALTESRLRTEKNALTSQLKDQVNWLTVLSKVGQSVTSTLELNEVLSRIVEAGVHLTRAEEGFLALLDQKSGQIYLRAVKNIDQTKSKTMRIPVSDSLIGKVITTGRPLRLSQMDESPLKVSTGFLVHSLLHVPLFSKGRVVGVLSVDNHSNRHAFKEVDEAMLTSLADYASVALENASLYQQAQQEITERKKIEASLRESEERYALAVRGANDGLWDWNLKTGQVYYSPRWKAMLGVDEEEVSSGSDEWFSRIHPDDFQRVKLDISSHYQGLTHHFESEHRMKHKNGSYRWMLSRGIAVWDTNGVAQRLVGSLTDIDDRKTAEQKLLHDAFHDTLTDLPNRSLFLDRLKQAVERTKRRPSLIFAVLYLDLDRFKDVNDSLGHMIGDQLLIKIGEMLGDGLRSTDTVARLGGDEFVILLDDISDIRDATRVANRIQEKLQSPFNLLDHEVFITASIGIVLSATGYENAEDVLRDADIAMYRAKAQGKARYEIFDSHMREKIMLRLALEADLRQAIDRREFRVHYQPIVALDTYNIIGFEALVRWQHRDRGLLNPGEFISIAEETGLIHPIGRWILQEACRQIHQWQSDYPTEPKFTISVNLSVKQVIQGNLVELVREVLEETELDPSFLKLELTENALLDSVNTAIEVFTKLRELGVQIQIDDFGVGYSSLSYLSHFPADTLKIDKSFISNMTSDESIKKIVESIVQLANGLGMNVIAEGVETNQQIEVLRKLGCVLAQGYKIAIPTGYEALSLMLAKTMAGENQFANRLSQVHN